MMRFYFWHILLRITLRISAAVGRRRMRLYALAFRFCKYCITQMKKSIPDEYQDQLIEIES